MTYNRISFQFYNDLADYLAALRMDISVIEMTTNDERIKEMVPKMKAKVEKVYNDLKSIADPYIGFS